MILFAEIIKNHAIFGKLDPELRAALVLHAEGDSFNAGESIFKAGEPAINFYMILSGKVSLDVYTPGKGRINVTTLSGQDILGWSWLFPPYEWHFDANVVEDVEVVKWNGTAMRKKCESNNRFGYKLMKCFSQIMLDRLVATRLQVCDLYKGHSVDVKGNVR